MSAAETTAIFDCFIDPLKNHDTIMFVGCVHAITDEFLAVLRRIFDNPPKYLIFGGDVTGSAEFETLKTLFYECVFNRAHNQLGIGTSDDKGLSDTELLAFQGHCPWKTGQTLGEGCIQLMTYVKMLENDDSVAARQVAERMSPAQLAEIIRYVATRDYFGSWHMALPLKIRQATADGIETEARRLAAALRPIQDAGTAITMVGGNWDDVGNNQEGNWGPDVRVFDTVPFFRSCGIAFHDCIAATETPKTLIISLPYWELARLNDGWLNRTVEAYAKADHARQAGKTVIAVAHAEPIWEVHSLKSPIPSQVARQQVIARLGTILADLKPDELIYPHQHNPLSDNDGKRLPSRTKYQLRVDKFGHSVQLIRDRMLLNQPDQITVSYLPYQRLGIISIPPDADPRLKPAGNREPITVF